MFPSARQNCGLRFSEHVGVLKLSVITLQVILDDRLVGLNCRPPLWLLVDQSKCAIRPGSMLSVCGMAFAICVVWMSSTGVVLAKACRTECVDHSPCWSQFGRFSLGRIPGLIGSQFVTASNAFRGDLKMTRRFMTIASVCAAVACFSMLAADAEAGCRRGGRRARGCCGYTGGCYSGGCQAGGYYAGGGGYYSGGMAAGGQYQSGSYYRGQYNGAPAAGVGVNAGVSPYGNAAGVNAGAGVSANGVSAGAGVNADGATAVGAEAGASSTTPSPAPNP